MGDGTRDSRAVDAIRGWIAEYGQAPSARAWDAAGRRPGYREIAATVGWREAIRHADGTPAAAGAAARVWTTGAVVAAIREWYSLTGRWPLAREWERAAPGRPTTSLVVKSIGWRHALDLAGADPREWNGGPGWRGSVVWTKVAIIEAMVAWTLEHGRLPKARDWARADPPRRPCASTVTHRMRWGDAAHAANELIALDDRDE